MRKTLLAVLITALIASSALGQTGKITYKANDVPIRSILPTIFQQAGVKSYVINPNVVGNITFELTEQSLENVLKIIVRSSNLTYTVQEGVYIVEPRKVTYTSSAPAVKELFVEEVKPSITREKISLMYLDPYDLMNILGPFEIIRSFSRFGTGFTGGMGMGSMSGGMSNGNSSFGNNFGGNSSMRGLGSPGGFGNSSPVNSSGPSGNG